jgi:hypothetical protein
LRPRSQRGGQDWNEPILRSMRQGVATIFFLGNAFCGSANCVREVNFAVRNGFVTIPVFLEWLSRDEDGFERWKEARTTVPGALLDADARSFDEWRVKADGVAFYMEGLQGVPADFFDLSEWTCEQCRSTKDSACAVCADWSVAIAREASGPKLLQAARALGKYIDRAVEMAMAASGSGLVRIPSGHQTWSEPSTAIAPQPQPQHKEAYPAKALRDHLRTLKLGALSRRATAAGVNEGLLEEAMEGHAPMAAVIELIVRAELIPEPEPTLPQPQPQPRPLAGIRGGLLFCFSYASEDRAPPALVSEAKAQLEAAGHRVFCGLDVSPTSADWRKDWNQQCETADYVVNFLTVAYVRSPACAGEWCFAKDTSGEGTVPPRSSYYRNAY